jgi:hypothetical protein
MAFVLDNVSPIEGVLFFLCPHCQGGIEVKTKELNCCIFRHGVFKNSLQPISPHLPKDECDALCVNECIYGCARPFRIGSIGGEKFKVEICEYI